MQHHIGSIYLVLSHMEYSTVSQHDLWTMCSTKAQQDIPLKDKDLDFPANKIVINSQSKAAVKMVLRLWAKSTLANSYRRSGHVTSVVSQIISCSRGPIFQLILMHSSQLSLSGGKPITWPTLHYNIPKQIGLNYKNLEFCQGNL